MRYKQAGTHIQQEERRLLNIFEKQSSLLLEDEAQTRADILPAHTLRKICASLSANEAHITRHGIGGKSRRPCLERAIPDPIRCEERK